MCLEINRLGYRQESVVENQWEDNDEFDSEYDIKLEELNDVAEVFYLIGQELQNSNIVQFKVEGFGKLPWPVDVSTDFLTVIEQIPDILKFLDSDLSTYNLEFYEQGIERKIFFRKEEDLIRLNCYGSKSEVTWGQNIEEKPLEKKYLKTMIYEMIKSFVSISNELCPTLTSHRSFQEWKLRIDMPY
ncbi:MAG TPA: hypothetical protein DEG17_25010 [Cyanobacteria bacterium UBA11149]|nr:hypothetical protein [Cyanobacteria bacterium UBA11367]HBE57564.1 hypothetical protein [Cyanobacteria bacterium UBA11366]HBK64316.1 hypothetical protein [Cyanobacteria bacterium UBA11166]HBR73292.1 hypothetical protein [Cyanobacteria bacterium UBA11159]HBS67760.1 hypothetical protein [Cyanobacteria bacterium UBA11153]HBW92039.1 hypothetical protein [Cyanobacteria bacterium UBA11149]HCA97961.1 hypothetical protein [Cyanobacteria bacterium UBA9226]